MDVPMRFQRENISNCDYIISPVADTKKTPSLMYTSLAF